jgi:hypothetical protein
MLRILDNRYAVEAWAERPLVDIILMAIGSRNRRISLLAQHEAEYARS